MLQNEKNNLFRQLGRQASNGGTGIVIDDETADVLITDPASHYEMHNSLQKLTERLTPREIDVFKRRLSEMDFGEIAKDLGIDPGRVREIFKQIRAKYVKWIDPMMASTP